MGTEREAAPNHQPLSLGLLRAGCYSEGDKEPQKILKTGKTCLDWHLKTILLSVTYLLTWATEKDTTLSYDISSQIV